MITTKRLILRKWNDADLLPFSKMNADPQVMEHFPALLNRQESDGIAADIMQHFDNYGYGLWAVEIPAIASFIGFVGLRNIPFHAHFTPGIEIGWRLASPHWEKGYAQEAANAALDYGFKELQLKEIFSFTTPQNIRSQKVMQKIGMLYQGEFAHPRLATDHHLSRHVLYRMASTEFSS